MIKMGSWWMSSEKDPRWNCSGRADVSACGMATEAQEKMASLKELYGEPPDDLSYGFMKD